MKQYSNKIFFFVIIGIGFCFFVPGSVYGAASLNIVDTQYFLDHGALIQVSGHTAGLGSISVTASAGSGANARSTSVVLLETSTPGTYSGYVYFVTSGSPPSGTLALLDPLPQTVTVSTTIVGASPASDTTSVINSEYSSIPTPPIAWLNLVPNCSSYNPSGDADGDKLCDAWEVTSGTCGLKIPYNGRIFAWGSAAGDGCPNPNKKDVYFEIDYLKGHSPDSSVLSTIRNAFAKAQLDAPDFDNPDGSTGIKLHLILNEQIDYHSDTINGLITCSGSTTEYDSIKQARFGTSNERSSPYAVDYLTAKKMAWHYALFVHSIEDSPTISGRAELPGNDVLVSLGRFTGGVGSVDEQVSTLMHEMGHNLGLDHGGPDADNCKPNYISIMSYSRQFKATYPSLARNLDFSNTTLNTQVKTNPPGLSEPIGISSYPSPTQPKTVYGVNGVPRYTNTGETVDWNWNGVETDTSVAQNINNLGTNSCTGTGSSTLESYDDWDHLNFDMFSGCGGSDGNRTSILGGAHYYLEKSGINQTRYQFPDKIVSQISDELKSCLPNCSDDMLKKIKIKDSITVEIVNDILTKTGHQDDEKVKAKMQNFAISDVGMKALVTDISNSFGKKNIVISDDTTTKLLDEVTSTGDIIGDLGGLSVEDPYTASSEFSIDMVREIRSSLVNTLANQIQGFNDSAFYNPSDRDILIKDLKIVDDLVKQDALSATIPILTEFRDKMEAALKPDEFNQALVNFDDIEESFKISLQPATPFIGKAPTEIYNYAPFKQFQYGLIPDDIECKEGFTKITGDKGRIACLNDALFQNHKIQLKDRPWFTEKIQYVLP